MSIEAPAAHATDLDIALIVPDDLENPEVHSKYLANLEALRALTPAVDARRNNPDLPQFHWGDASGRTEGHIAKAHREHEAVGAPLPKSTFMVARVGEVARVRNQQTDKLEALPNWPPRATTERWSLPKVNDTLQGIVDNSRPGTVIWQEKVTQSTFKRSLYVSEDFAQELNETELQAFLANIEATLANVGVEANILFSGGANLPFRFLDVMAKGIDKGTACTAICDHLGVPYENRSCSVDSGNDYELALASHRVIALPNGEATFIPRLRQAFKRTPERLIVPEGLSAAGVHEALVSLGRLPA